MGAVRRPANAAKTSPIERQDLSGIFPMRAADPKLTILRRKEGYLIAFRRDGRAVAMIPETS